MGEHQKAHPYPVDNDRVIRLAQELLRIPSFTYKESEVAKFLYGYLQGSGFKVDLQTVSMPGGVSSHQTIARWQGDKFGPKFLLCGHIDVMDVYRPDRWTVPQFGGFISDGWLYGQGSLNMKAGVAAMIGAVEALMYHGFQLNGEIVIAAVLGEIIGGVGIRHLLQCEKDFDFAIVPEPTNLCVSNIAVGTVQGRIRLWGDTLYFNPHANPIYAMSKFLEGIGPSYAFLKPSDWATYELCPDLPGFPRINARRINSGQDYCEIFFDARVVPGMTDDSLRSDIERLWKTLEPSLPGISLEIFIPTTPDISHFPALPALPPNNRLIQSLIHSHSKVKGLPPLVGAGDRLGLASDASHIKAAGIPVVDYGPGKHPRWPMVDERILLEDVLVASEVIKETLMMINSREE